MAFFTGQAMKRTKGKANPKVLRELFEQELKK
jgi:Asp-tRNA(Asn)/Glu-tRNA(Gln) amidotransferase B subunit